MVSRWQGWQLATGPAPCTAQLTLVTRVGPDSTQKERCTQLTPVHLPEGSSFPSERLCPCSLCAPSPPVIPILPGLGLSLTSSGTSPLTTFTNMTQYHQRISKAPKAAVTYHHCLGFLLVHSFHETSCAPTGGYLWKDNVQRNARAEIQPFLFYKT